MLRSLLLLVVVYAGLRSVVLQSSQWTRASVALLACHLLLHLLNHLVVIG